MCASNEDPEFIAQAKTKGTLDILAKSTAPEKPASLLDQLKQAEEVPADIVATPTAADDT